MSYDFANSHISGYSLLEAFISICVYYFVQSYILHCFTLLLLSLCAYNDVCIITFFLCILINVYTQTQI